MFYWALQYGTSVEVLEPAELRQKIKDAVQKISEKYEACT
jgi:predicted DNA-binding transcriptional regulator YafY